MGNQKYTHCTGFDENVVLAVKTCFFDGEMRQILIEKAAEKIVYHDRCCNRQGITAVFFRLYRVRYLLVKKYIFRYFY
jgi:hypothetical protein